MCPVVANLYTVSIISNSVEQLITLVDDERESRAAELDFEDILRLSAAVMTSYDKTRVVSTHMKPTLTNYAIYSFICVVQTTLGILLNYTETEDSKKVLVPLWSIGTTFGIGAVFAIMVSSLCHINLKFERLKDSLAHYLVVLRAIEGRNISTDRPEKRAERITMASMIEALLRLDTSVANVFGIPITSRFMTTIWSQGGVACFVVAQFVLVQQGRSSRSDLCPRSAGRSPRVR